MNRERAKELLPIITAFANGEDIQFHDVIGWSDIGDEGIDPEGLDDDGLKFRIKPSPREWWVRLGKEGNLLSTSENPMVEKPGTTTVIKVREILE